MKKQKIKSALTLLFSFSLSTLFQYCVYGSVVEVPADQPTIQAGIAAANAGDTVLVAPGLYLENINYLGKKIVVASQFVLNRDYSLISTTIIDGSSPAHPDTASCVRFISGEDSSSVLEGFTLTGGTGTIWPDIHIGGKYREGGGILIELSSPTIKHNLIIDNEAIDKSAPGVTSAGGGAIRCGDGNPRILNNVIMGNQGLYGAGIVLNFSGGIIKNNIIYQNSGGQDFSGSGIWSYSNGPAPKIFENNTIVENSSTGSGAYGGRAGALMVWSTTVTARNNIIWGNSQSNGGPVAVLSGTANMTYSNVEGGWTGEGNIDINPAFADSNLYLTPTSPCVDSGDPDPLYNDPEDSGNPGFAQWPAQGALHNDMGAYGGPLSAWLPGSILTGILHNVDIPEGFKLEQNYPNPFNPSTRILYSIPRPAFVELTIFDVTGQKVNTLVTQFQSAGSYSVEYIGGAMPSGIYFYSLQAGNYSAVRKMLQIQ